MVLYEYGEVYADLDMEALRPLDDIVTQYSCILSQEPLEHAHFSPMGVCDFICDLPHYTFLYYYLYTIILLAFMQQNPTVLS